MVIGGSKVYSNRYGSSGEQTVNEQGLSGDNTIKFKAGSFGDKSEYMDVNKFWLW